MSITRRDALAAVVGCGLMATPAAWADDKPAAKEPPTRDPVYSQLPEAIRKVFEETFPNHRCIRLAIRGKKDAAVYRATVFHPASMGSSHQRVAGEHVATPILYHLELDAGGKVVEETAHWIDPKRWPKAVQASYRSGTRKGLAARSSIR